MKEFFVVFDFVNFLNKFIVKKYKNKLIVLDNASSHINKNKETKTKNNVCQ